MRVTGDALYVSQYTQEDEYSPVRFICSYLTVDKLFPVKPRAITGPPKLDLLEAESTPELIVKPRLILVVHLDDLNWYTTSNQLGQMFIQNLNRIFSKAKCYSMADLVLHHRLFQLTWCFMEAFLLWPQVWNHLSHRNDCRQREVIWVNYWCYNMHGSGKTTNWSQPELPDTVAKSKDAIPRRFVVVEPIHFWWWPFKSPTNRKDTHTSFACTAATDASQKWKILSSSSWLRYRLTHKSYVLHH